MNLNTVIEVKRPASANEITQWRDGYAWLAGGTWLFSEPQWTTDTLIDLDQLRWPALKVSPSGLEIAATCRIAELYQFDGPAEWIAARLFRQCCDSFAGLIQNLERRDGRRQHLHVPAGRRDDLTDCRTGGDLYAVAA